MTGKRDPGLMKAFEVNAELRRLERDLSVMADEFISAGRGSELPSETRLKTDPLSVRWRNLQDRVDALRAEVERRYGPNPPARLPRGMGPTKKE